MAGQFGYASHASEDIESRAPWIAYSNVIEPLQGVVFTIQQLIISAVYIKAAWNHLQSSLATHKRVRKLMRSLIAVQALVFVVDVAVIVLECVGYFVLKMIIHSFIYSIKLEIEFVVLNQLVALSQAGAGQSLRPQSDLEANSPPDFSTGPELALVGFDGGKDNPDPIIAPSSPDSISVHT
jgi:hypothetical protein